MQSEREPSRRVLGHWHFSSSSLQQCSNRCPGRCKEEHGPPFPSVYLKPGDLYGYVVCMLDATLPCWCEQRDKSKALIISSGRTLNTKTLCWREMMGGEKPRMGIKGTNRVSGGNN